MGGEQPFSINVSVLASLSVKRLAAQAKRSKGNVQGPFSTRTLCMMLKLCYVQIKRDQKDDVMI